MKANAVNQLGVFNTSLNFNLREPKKKASVIYAVVKVGQKQVKIPLREKILTCAWNSKKQECQFLPALTQAENARNLAVNEKISNVKFCFYKNFLYLCNIGDCVEQIKNYIETATPHNNETNSMGRPKAATTLIKEAFAEWKDRGTAKESTVNQNKTTVSKFCRYISEGKKADSARNYLTSKAIKEWADMMCEQGTAARTIDENCKLITKLINDYLSIKYDLGRVVYKNISHKVDGGKRTEVTEEELQTLEMAQDLNTKETEAKDLFIMQCLTGVRVSDLPKLFSKDFTEGTEDGVKTLTIETKKNEISAYIVVNEKIETLMQKYEGKRFKHLQPKDAKSFEERYNRVLRALFAKCGIEREITYKQQQGKKVIEVTGKLCNLITSHFARHTFITQKCREGWSAVKLKFCTGHTSDKMITEIYSHLSKAENDDKNRKQVVEEYKRVQGVATQEQSAQGATDIIKEKKSVLAFLGAPADEFIDCEDIDTLDNLIFRKYEKRLFAQGVPVEKIKEIYNGTGTVKDKKRVLDALKMEMENASI